MAKKAVNQAASTLGKLSVKKRHQGKTKKEISEMYSKLSFERPRKNANPTVSN